MGSPLTQIITYIPPAYLSLALTYIAYASLPYPLVSELDGNCLMFPIFAFVSFFFFVYQIVVSGGEHVDEIIGAAVADGKVTPKVQSLVKILLKYQHTEDFRAIIFVERVVSALVLPKVDYFTEYFSLI